MSSTLQPLPSRCAAMPRSAPIVTTPVPPMPVTRMPYGSAVAGRTGSGRSGNSPAAAFFGFRSVPPSTVTKLGQKPLTHEKSLLHELWSIVRFRPNSVSTGATDTQFDLTPQSPQPSQTSSLMNDALRRIGELAALAPAALLRRAGLVVEQHRAARRVAQLALDGVELVAVVDLDVRRRNSPTGYLSGSSVTTTILATPSAATWRAIAAGVSGPSNGWPPVIATASL